MIKKNTYDMRHAKTFEAKINLYREAKYVISAIFACKIS